MASNWKLKKKKYQQNVIFGLFLYYWLNTFLASVRESTVKHQWDPVLCLLHTAARCEIRLFAYMDILTVGSQKHVTTQVWKEVWRSLAQPSAQVRVSKEIILDLPRALFRLPILFKKQVNKQNTHTLNHPVVSTGYS